jgi:protein ImuB
MFAAVCAAEGSPSNVLMEVARDFSPRVEACGPREVTLDLSGLARLFGDGKAIAAELRRTAADHGLRVRVAVAGTRTAARLLAHYSADRKGPPYDDVIVIEPGSEATTLAPLPLSLLASIANGNDSTAKNVSNAPNTPNDPNDMLSTVRRWGLRTLGDLASLPPDEVAARLGQTGVEWQRLARGEDRRPLLPAVPEERFEQALDLEWPIEGLEPLSFVLGRLLEPLSAHLERRDRGGAVLHVRLHLVTREVHERSLQLPAPIRDARTLRTLALLDLESHPPSAAIDRVVVAIDPTPGRVVQFSLLTRPLPSPEQVSTLMARLNALMGEGRCGTAVAVDSWEPGAFAMKPFAPSDSAAIHSNGPQRRRDTESSNAFQVNESRAIERRANESLCDSVSLWPVAVEDAAKSPAVAIRRFRFPVPARVRVDRGAPVRVISDRRGWSGGHVETYAGPWRSSGGWWVDAADVHRGKPRSHGGTEISRTDFASATSGKPWPVEVKAWERDEWDVTLSDGATYRIFRERDTDAWFIEGVVD